MLRIYAGKPFKESDDCACCQQVSPMGLFGAKKEIDPVCHMSVDPKSAKWKSEHEGKTYYFCGPGCKQQFDKNPYKFLGSSAPHSM